MIHGDTDPNRKYAENNPQCDHDGQTILNGTIFLIMCCYECDRWCQVPANWFTPPGINLHIDD